MASVRASVTISTAGRLRALQTGICLLRNLTTIRGYETEDARALAGTGDTPVNGPFCCLPRRRIGVPAGTHFDRWASSVVSDGRECIRRVLKRHMNGSLWSSDAGARVPHASVRDAERVIPRRSLRAPALRGPRSPPRGRRRPLPPDSPAARRQSRRLLLPRLPEAACRHPAET